MSGTKITFDNWNKNNKYKEEMKRVREVAKDFALLIDMKQTEYDEFGIDYEMKDLVAGTQYENVIAFQNDCIEHVAKEGVYQWAYTRRVGNTPAHLTEIHGFYKHG